MMNRNVATGLIAFILGGVIGAFVTNQLLKKKYEDICEEELISLRTFVRPAKEPEPEELNGERDPKDVIGKVVDMKYRRPQAEKKAYDAIFKGSRVAPTDEEVIAMVAAETAEGAYPADEDEEEPEITEDPVHIFVDGKVIYMDGASSMDPFIISCDSFSDEKPLYDKITLHYYDIDDVLADEDDEAVPSPDQIIGMDAISNFGETELSDDPDIVYVRNPRLSSDFEVIRLHKNFHKVILGVEEAPAKKKAPKSADESSYPVKKTPKKKTGATK